MSSPIKSSALMPGEQRNQGVDGVASGRGYGPHCTGGYRGYRSIGGAEGIPGYVRHHCSTLRRSCTLSCTGRLLLLHSTNLRRHCHHLAPLCPQCLSSSLYCCFCHGCCCCCCCCYCCCCEGFHLFAQKMQQRTEVPPNIYYLHLC